MVQCRLAQQPGTAALSMKPTEVAVQCFSAVIAWLHVAGHEGECAKLSLYCVRWNSADAAGEIGVKTGSIPLAIFNVTK